jgi:hypothetical protein
MSSSSSPHAGHLALLTLPILLRYPFSGKCVSRSWAIVLATVLESLGLLIDLRNLVDGVVSSIASVAVPRFEVLHSSCHSLARLSLYAFLTADGLISMGFQRYLGSCFVSVVRPLAASLASLSANLFPSNPSCPAIH